MTTDFKCVDHQTFRETLKAYGGTRIKTRKESTYLYDPDNRILAILKPAAISPCGKTIPHMYYVRS